MLVINGWLAGWLAGGWTDWADPPQVVLVEDLPQLHVSSQREAFHALVRRYADTARRPAVFVLSSHATVYSRGAAAETPASAYFPPAVLVHAGVSEVRACEKRLADIVEAVADGGWLPWDNA
jgi:hypothetical protein